VGQRALLPRHLSGWAVGLCGCVAAHGAKPSHRAVHSDAAKIRRWRLLCRLCTELGHTEEHAPYEQRTDHVVSSGGESCTISAAKASRTVGVSSQRMVLHACSTRSRKAPQVGQV
jgi:hypothetical protein